MKNIKTIITLCAISSLIATTYAMQVPQQELDTQFITAVKTKNVAAAQKLLQQGADVNARDGQNTALTVAITHESVPMVALLLSQPEINVMLKFRYGSDPLFSASLSKNTQILNLLLNHTKHGPLLDTVIVETLFKDKSTYFNLLPADLISLIPTGSEYSISTQEIENLIKNGMGDPQKTTILNALEKRKNK
jgi:hypothetical protein